MSPRVVPFGDGAVLVLLPAALVDPECRAVHRLARAIAAWSRGRAGWGVPVPAAESVLVRVDPLEPGAVAAAAALDEAMPALLAGREEDDADAGAALPVLEVPTRYGGDDGPDLAWVAERCGLTAAEVVERHAATEVVVRFLGFAPGFGYLGPVDPTLAVPRLEVPRVRVPAGSVALAGTATAVYPSVSPGGWRLIGRTDLRLWDPGADPPTPLSPGRRVRFVPVGEAP